MTEAEINEWIAELDAQMVLEGMADNFAYTDKLSEFNRLKARRKYLAATISGEQRRAA